MINTANSKYTTKDNISNFEEDDDPALLEESIL